MVANITIPFSTASSSECPTVSAEYQHSAWQEACRRFRPIVLSFLNDIMRMQSSNGALLSVEMQASTWMEIALRLTISPAAPGLPFCEWPWPLTSTCFYLWMTVIVRYWLPRCHLIQTDIRASGRMFHLPSRGSARHQATIPSLPFWQVLENPISAIIRLLENFFSQRRESWQVTEVAISCLRSHLYFISIRTNPL